MCKNQLMRRGDMKVLFLTRFDFLDNKMDGGVLCSCRNYEMLCRLYGKDNVFLCILSPKKKENGHGVTYIKIDGNVFSRYIDYLFLREGFNKRTQKEIIDYLQRQNADIIFYDGSTFGEIISSHELRGKNNIVFFHNVERQYAWEQVKGHSVLCIFRYIATRYNENKMAYYGRKIICLNERDNKLLKKFYGREAEMILPATFDDRLDETKIKKMVDNKSSERKLLYIGSYFAHNTTGLTWFIKSVMPYIDCELRVVGKNMEKLRDKLPQMENVKIIGTVDDLEPYYIEADAMVMPIFMGGGMKIKTAEALMFGKTIFGSAEALEGYDIQEIEGIYKCNTAEEFITSINHYFQNKKRKKFNLSVREVFLNNHCTEGYLMKLKNIIDGKNVIF